MTELPDEQIVQCVTDGDTDAYGQLMERYETKLRRYVVYLIHDEPTSHDIVQDTFIKAYQNLRSYNPKYKFSSWIYRIAHNEAMNVVKRQRLVSDAAIDELPVAVYDAKIGEKIDSDILKAHIHDCLSKLEPKYREVVQLVYLEHMKYDEVADTLHIPTSTVGVWLSRAKAKLKVICEQKGVRK